MSTHATEGRPGKGAHLAVLPHLPPVARDPIDDAKEVLAAFSRKQDGELDLPYADLSEDLAPALQAALRMLSRPAAKPALNLAAALRLDQAELFLLSLDNEMLTADSMRAAYLLGLAETHLANMIELIQAVAA